MAKYTGPSVPDNAVVIGTDRGRITPDIYGTYRSQDDECEEKIGHPHSKLIHGNIREWYGNDSEPTEPW